MRRHILFVTPYFPPFAPVGAVRMAKLAKYWRRCGHDVTVLATYNPDFAGTLAVENDGSVAYHLPYDAPGLETPAQSTQTAKVVGQGRAEDVRKPGWLKRQYRTLMTTPDRYRGHWVRNVAAKARAIDAVQPIDLIYSSGPPQSAHLAAKAAAVATGKPWIAELRDLWLDNPYVERALPYRLWSDHMARQTLGTASAFVTVTQEFAHSLTGHFNKPVTVAYNGYDPDDFAGLDGTEPLDPDRLTIIHAGVIYAQRRDPSALFEAIAMLGDDKDQVRAIFYHDEGRFVTELAQHFGIVDQVELRPLQPRREILRVERAADVLLLCRWNDRRDDGVIPGKLFEYIGACRPVLAVGSETGEAADIVRAGDFGLVSNQPAVIATALRDWIAQKRAHGGRLPDMSSATQADYDRTGQFDRVEDFITTFMRQR